MVNLFEFSVNIVEETIVIGFLTAYFGCRYKGIKMIAAFCIGLFCAVSTVTYLNNTYIYEGFLGLIFSLIFFLYSLLFLKGDPYTKLFISGFINCIVYFIALFSTLCIAEIFTHDYRVLYGMTMERIFLIVLSKVLLIGVCILLLKFKFHNIAKRRNMMILIMMPVVAEMSMVGIMQVFLKYSELKSELLLATVSVMLANILTYYVFIKINKDAEAEKEKNSIRQKYENDKRYASDVESLYKKTCSMRHDLLLHFTTIRGLLQSDVNKAEQYISAILQNQLDTIKNLVKTDNETFDAIVNAKIAVCDKFGIRVQTRVKTGSLGKLKLDEIAVIFGNLFDNAIEASKNSEEKYIELDVQTQEQYLSIFMSNSIDESVLANNKGLNTTKSEKEYHGYGIKNIRRIVKSRHGMVDFFEENGRFCVDIYIQ
ncbi:MAG: GHKL domain-containing protein [bacterium]|nr:GHKL domain-containing protein [bacterium]